MATLIRPPPVDPSLSSIENVLELIQLPDIDPNLFTNKRPLWHPPGARGIFGGAAIAQTLSAAQKTVDPDFTVHSMHCYFVLAGNAEIPVVYHVERVRSGKSFATRTVQARQRGKVIFTTTMSFVRQNSGGADLVEHIYPMPDVPGPIEDNGESEVLHNDHGPFVSQQLPIVNGKCLSMPVSWSLRLISSRTLGQAARQEMSTMGQGARPHLPRRRPRSSPLGHSIHVGQLLYRYRCACT